jgi:hypothetical protein
MDDGKADGVLDMVYQARGRKTRWVLSWLTTMMAEGVSSWGTDEFWLLEGLEGDAQYHSRYCHPRPGEQVPTGRVNQLAQ